VHTQPDLHIFKDFPSLKHRYISQVVIKVGSYFLPENTQWIKRFLLSYGPSKLVKSEESYECTFNLTDIFFKLFRQSNIGTHILGCN